MPPIPAQVRPTPHHPWTSPDQTPTDSGAQPREEVPQPSSRRLRLFVFGCTLATGSRLFLPRHSNESLWEAWNSRVAEAMAHPQWSILSIYSAAALAALGIGVIVEARALRRSTLIAVAAVAALAAALRSLAPAVPHDINDRSIHVFLAPLSDSLASYGWGYPSVFATLFHLIPILPAQQSTIFHVGPVVGAMTAALVVLLTRSWGARRSTATVAGFLYAVANPAVYFGHTDAPGLPESLFFLSGLLALTRHAQAPTVSRAWAAALWIFLSASMRPEGLMLLPIAALTTALICTPTRALLFPLGMGAVVSSPVLAFHLHIVWRRILESDAGYRSTITPLAGTQAMHERLRGLHWEDILVLDPAYTHPWISGLLVLGLVWGAVPSITRTAAALLVVSLHFVILITPWSPAGGECLVVARHQLRALPFTSMVVALGLGRITSTVPALTWPFVGLTALAAVRTLPMNYEVRTYAQEYVWAYQAIQAIPSDCQVLYWKAPGDWSLGQAHTISFDLGLGHEWRAVNESWPPRSPCEVWYRSSNCSVITPEHRLATRQGLPPGDPDHCHSSERLMETSTIEETYLSARTYVFDHYATDPIRVGVYRIHRRPDPSPRTTNEAVGLMDQQQR